jgi:hypothetical protein
MAQCVYREAVAQHSRGSRTRAPPEHRHRRLPYRKAVAQDGVGYLVQPLRGRLAWDAARCPGVREYATPGCVVQPLRGKDTTTSGSYFAVGPKEKD